METTVTYGQLDTLLCSLGFHSRPTRHGSPGTIYKHDTTDAVVMLPLVAESDKVLEHHLVAVQTELDNFGLVDSSVFASRVRTAG